jgi:hypothetical protein
MKNSKYIVTLIYLGLSLSGFAQQPFTAGNIAVYRVGTGSSTLNNNAAPVFLDEYTPAGVLVQSIAMPTAPSGSNSRLTAEGDEFDGMLTLSSNGRYMVVPGTNTQVGTSPGGTAVVIGLVDFNGNINTSTAITDYAESDYLLYSAVSDDGNRLWFGRYDAIRYTTVGSSTSTALVSTGDFIDALTIANGQLYTSIQGPAVSKIGTGLPTTGGQASTGLPGLSLGGIPQQFAFADLDLSVAGVDVLYVATYNGGIEKFSLVGGSWTANGVIGTGADGYLGLTIKVSGSTVTIFATRNGPNINSIKGGELVTLTDNSGYNATISGTPTSLANVVSRFGTANFASFRGVALVPQGPSVKVSAKIFLQGAYSTILGRHKDVNATWAAVLNANALTQPFNTAAFGNYGGTETVSSGFFTSTVANTDITDWVLVELRDATTPTTVIARRAAFVREDGQVVDVDGTSPVNFPNVSDGNYYIVIKHRNHLGVRSAAAIALSSTAASYDFTTAQSQAFQDGTITTNAAMVDLTGGGVGPFAMWGGNTNSNTETRASGSPAQNDYLYLVNTLLGGNTATILSNVYSSGDINLDGAVRASGTPGQNDYLILVNNILGGNTAVIYKTHQ